MKDETIAQRLATLRERWIARDIAYDRPAADTDVAAFETRYGVVLPADLRAYFTTVNGSTIGAYGMQDEHMLGFWHLDEVRTFAELEAEFGPTTPEAERTFVIADHSIWVYGFGIQLSADPAAPTPVVVDIGTPYHVVAGSFTEFLDAYLRDDEDVIYPEPVRTYPDPVPAIHHPPSPPRRRAMKIVLAVLALAAAAVVAIVLASRAERITPTAMALAREIQPGMSVSEVTAVLQRHDVPFTVERTARRTTVVKYGREASRNGVSEQQLVFDARGRLRDMVIVSQVRMP
jgi:hypothetical protein